MTERALILSLMLLGWSATAPAQEPSARPDSARAQMQATLRRFYFNLAHSDWEALTSDILPAKVVAHRPAPEALVSAARRPRSRDSSAACAAGDSTQLDRASIALDGDWAEVTVPRCEAASAGSDEFRLIRFQERWRLVYIELFRERVSVTAER